jgi:ACT domain-containing protein
MILLEKDSLHAKIELMNEITRSSRIASAIQVIQRTSAGMSVSKACREVGLPRSSFYAIIDREKEAIAKYQDMIVANSMDELLMILATRNEVLMKLLREALA